MKGITTTITISCQLLDCGRNIYTLLFNEWECSGSKDHKLSSFGVRSKNFTEYHSRGHFEDGIQF